MVDEPRFYEPWTPLVGQRVRVRLSGECRQDHYPEEDGRIGTMSELVDWDEVDEDDSREPPAPPEMRAHRYIVDFDVPFLSPDDTGLPPWLRSNDYGFYCAIELERLD